MTSRKRSREDNLDGDDDDDRTENQTTTASTKSKEAHVRDIIEPKPLGDGQYCKLMSWNVAGLRGILKNKPTVLKDLVRNHDPDILTLQETKLQSSDGFDDYLENYNSYWTCSETKKGYAGVVVFVKKSLDCSQAIVSNSIEKPKKSKQSTLSGWTIQKTPNNAVMNNQTNDSLSVSSKNEHLKVQSVKYELDDSRFNGEGRTITIDFSLFYVVACYVPNSGQNLERLKYRVDEWDPYMRSYLSTLHQKKPVIFMGDLNVGHLDLDIHNPSAKHIVKQAGLTPEERNSMTKLLSSEFTDAFRYLYPDARGQFTYWSQRMMSRPVNRGIRLDYFICTNDMLGIEDKPVERVESIVVTTESQSSTSPNKKKSKKAEVVESVLSPEPLVIQSRLIETKKFPSVYDSYILHADTVGSSDHCPVVLVLKIAEK